MNLFSPTISRVFFPFALGYFISYLYRVVNAVIAPDLVAELAVNPSQLGLLTSVYFIAFASSQLPLGILLDRFGPRRVNAFLLMVAGAGALVFARSSSLSGLVIGRGLIGLGVSACLMAAFKSYVLWFPERLWARINGFQMAAGGLGALAGAAPVAWTLHATGWRSLFAGLSALTVLIAVIIFFIVPEKKTAAAQPGIRHLLAEVAGVFSSADFWRIAPLTTAANATFMSLQGLWAGPWLRDVGGLDPLNAARVLSWSAISMVAGFILLGLLAEILSKRGIPVLITSVCGMTAFMGIQAMIIFRFPGYDGFLWIGFGFTGTASILSYTALSLRFPKALSGRVTTGINLLVFIAAFISQWAIGGIIGLWTPNPSGVYGPDAFQTAFLLMLVLQVLCLIWFCPARRSRPSGDRTG